MMTENQREWLKGYIHKMKAETIIPDSYVTEEVKKIIEDIVIHNGPIIDLREV